MKTNHILTLLLILSLSVLLNSCTKVSTELTIIEFVMLNPANGEPFVGVPVKINEEEAKKAGIVSHTIFEGETDANGKCKFEFHAKKGSNFWYYPYINEGYFGTQGEGFDFSYLARPVVSSYAIKKDQYNEARYEITFYAYLREVFKNTHCEGIEDTIYIHYEPSLVTGTAGVIRDFKLGGCEEHSTGGGWGGAPQGYVPVFMGKNKYTYEVHRSSGITYGKDSIYLEQQEMGIIEINY